MKRPNVMILLAALLCLMLFTAAQSARKAPDRATSTGAEAKAKPAEPAKATTGTTQASKSTAASVLKPVKQRGSAPVQSPAEPEPVTGQPESDLKLTQPTVNSPAGTAAYEIPWQSVNAGGQHATSATYEAYSTAGQTAIGVASSATYQAGAGFWYGASASGGGCSCPHQADYDADGFLTALDLGNMIDVLFAGKPDIRDPQCPTTREDFDNDNFPTALDLGMLIDHLFAGAPGPCDPCNPVQGTCAK